MKKDNTHIVLRGNKLLDAKLKKVLSRKDKVRKLIQLGASISDIRKVAPIS